MPLSASLPTVSNTDDDRPLPLIVAEKWSFPLAYVETQEGNLYSIQDWIRGLTQESDIRKVLSKMQKQMGEALPRPYDDSDQPRNTPGVVAV